jgi:hypothetical protein
MSRPHGYSFDFETDGEALRFFRNAILAHTYDCDPYTEERICRYCHAHDGTASPLHEVECLAMIALEDAGHMPFPCRWRKYRDEKPKEH